MGSELLQDSYGRGLVVDEDSSLSAGRDFAAQNDGVALGVETVFLTDLLDGFFSGRLGFERGGDNGAVGTRTDLVAGGLFAEKQRQGVNKYRFAGSGFAGEQVQARSELDDQIIDDRVVLEAQFDEHGCPRIREVERRIA